MVGDDFEDELLFVEELDCLLKILLEEEEAADPLLVLGALMSIGSIRFDNSMVTSHTNYINLQVFF